MYLELCVNIWVSVYAGLNYDNKDQVIASILGILIFSLVTLSPIAFYSLIMDKFNLLPTKEFRSKYKMLVESTKLRSDSTLNQMWIPIFLFRRYTYSGVLCVFQNYPFLQLVFCIVQSIIVRSQLI